jgi:hypothetical protein
MSSQGEGGSRSTVLERRGFILWSFAILLIFGLPFFAFVVGKISNFSYFNPVAPSCDEGEVNCARPVSYVGLNWLAIASCAALFGSIGVMLSLVLRRRIDDHLSRLTVGRILIVVYGVGAIFAILLLALFVGGFLQGNLFPDFSKGDSWITLRFRVPDWGKLVVWSFIAGFSERLIPTLFDRLIDRMLEQESSKQT